MGSKLDPEKDANNQKQMTELAERARRLLLRYASHAADPALHMRHRESAITTAQKVVNLVGQRDAVLAGQLASLLSSSVRSVNEHGNYVADGALRVFGR